MLPVLNRPLVNWVDGMKINKGHFIDQELALKERIRDAAGMQLTSYSYGLLQPLFGLRASLDVQLVSDRFNVVRITLRECRGITQGGVRVEISQTSQVQQEEGRLELSAELNLNTMRGREFFLVVSVNPMERVPVGAHDPDEYPPRYPYVNDRYRLSILPAEELSPGAGGYYHLTIGRALLEGSEVRLDENYIPPSTSMLAHPALAELHLRTESHLTTLERAAVEVIQKVVLRKQEKALPQAAAHVATALRDYIGARMADYRQLMPEQAPIAFANYLSGLARVVRNALDSRNGTGREEFVNYVCTWARDMTQGEFDSQIDRAMNARYDHTDIRRSLAEALPFVEHFATLFKTLASLDYIGDRPGGLIVDQPGYGRTPQAQPQQQPRPGFLR